MRFETKQIVIRKLERHETNGGKSWAAITMKPDRVRWLPSFEEVFYTCHVVAHVIAVCEQEKYNLPGQRGADMVADFLESIAGTIRGSGGRLTESQIEWLWFQVKDRFEIP